MKTPTAERPLERIPHDELIRLFFTDPQNQVLANEFMARYDAVIRQTVANVLYKRKAPIGYKARQPMIEDIVSETYCRLLQNDCQVLRSFKCRYANSIFSYLRTIAFSVASNQLRSYGRQKAFGALPSLDEIKDRYESGWGEASLTLPPGETTASQEAERKSTEERCRENFRLAFRDAKVNRNFIIFKLHFLYGYHSEEIAHIKGLGLSGRGVGNMADRMRRHLRTGNSGLN